MEKFWQNGDRNPQIGMQASDFQEDAEYYREVTRVLHDGALNRQGPLGLGGSRCVEKTF
jgi:hypothetical protein